MKPSSFDDGNIIRGTGTNDDYPNGLPKGSVFRGKVICGAPTKANKPCIRKPQEGGRCIQHSGLEIHRKTPEKSFYNSVYTPDETKHTKEVKIGNLKEEIILFKILLKRVIEAGKWSVKEITTLAHTIKELEDTHFRLMGGEIKGNPLDMVLAMKQATIDMDNSVVSND